MSLKPVNFNAPEAPAAFVQSLRETGFGVLKNHPILQEQVEAIYSTWRDFFAQEAKHRYLYNEGTHDGYFPTRLAEAAKGRDVRDLKEYFQFYLWGQCPEELRDQLTDYYVHATQVATQLLEWVEEQSPPAVRARFSMPLPDMLIDSEQSMLRILHYPPLQGDEAAAAIRASAHEDINLLTLLPASNEPGLQVQRTDGSWFDVPCDFGHLIVNIGDMLQEASGGYFPSTTHRVINPPDADMNRSRISLPLFLHPHPDVVLSERYTAGSYLKQRIAELADAKK